METYGLETAQDDERDSLRDSGQVRSALARVWWHDALVWSSVILTSALFLQVPSAWLIRGGQLWLDTQYAISDWNLALFVLAVSTLMLKLQQARAAATLIPQVLNPELDRAQASVGLAQAKKAQQLEQVLIGLFWGSLALTLIGGVIATILSLLDQGRPASWLSTAMHGLVWVALKCWDESTTAWVMPAAVRNRSTPDGKQLLRLARWNRKGGERWRGLPADGAFVRTLAHLTHRRMQGIVLEAPGTPATESTPATASTTAAP